MRPMSCLLLLGLCACAQPRTQLVPVVSSDLPDAQIACVVAEASRIDAGAPFSPIDTPHWFHVHGPGIPAVSLPFSFGLLPPGDDASARVELRVSAMAGCDESSPSTPTVTRIVRTGFIRGQRLALPVFLSARCAAVTCPDGQTCEAGACVAIPEIDPTSLSPVARDGDELSDGGRPAGTRRDAGPLDGGPAGPAVGGLAFDWLLQGYEVPAATDPRTRVTALCGTPTGVAVAGFTTKEANFGVSLASSTAMSSGPAAVWVAHVSSSGVLEWLRPLEGTAAIASIDLLDGQLVVTGAFVGTFPVAPVTLTAVDMQDAFAAGLDPSSGATLWASSLGTNGGVDVGVGAAVTDLGVVVASRTVTTSPIHVGGLAPSTLDGDASGQGVLATLDPSTGALVRATGIGTGALDALWIDGDSARGVLVGLASNGRMTGLHPLVAGGAGHEVAVVRLDSGGGWLWTTYLAGCTDTTSIRVTRNAGVVWVALTDAGCGSLPVTLAGPSGSASSTAVVPGASAEILLTLALGAGDGAPLAAATRAVAIGAGGGRVSALSADGADALYVGGWIGLPTGSAMIDFGGGSQTFTRNMAGAVQSNGVAFLWSRGLDGSFRGVDSWSNGGAGSVSGQSDVIAGIVVDAAGITYGGWLHGVGTMFGEWIGGGTGYDVGFLVHAH